MRLALGGDRSHIVWIFLRYGVSLAAMGLFAGMALSLLFGKLLSRLVFGVKPVDPIAFAAAACVLAAATMTASFLPAFRASKIDPMRLLRHE